jgi:5-formyltetrahydrofolate cyclo-ligase
LLTPRIICYTFIPVMLSKSGLRGLMKETLFNLSPRQVDQKSGRIFDQLVSLPCFTVAGQVLVYISIDAEVDTGRIIRAAGQAGKQVFAPRITGSDLVFHLIPESAAGLERNRFGIPEPPAGRPLFNPNAAGSDALDRAGTSEAGRGRVLVITPGLAFDRVKNRLGRGRGYYDRFIRHLREDTAGGCTIVGICFAEQMVDRVPVGNGDIPMDMVITDGEVIS